MSYRNFKMRFPEGKDRAVSLSYDDGCDQDLRMLEILDRYGMKCTVNLNGEEFSPNVYTKEVAEEKIYKKGHEIAVHGLLHKSLGKIRPVEGIREILDCRVELERKYGRIITGLAYAGYGIRMMSQDITYEEIRGYLSSLGISYARTLGGDNNLFELPKDWYAWMPTAHHNNPKLMEYCDDFINVEVRPIQDPLLFYLWGHSSEFDKYDNWDVLENFCEKMKGHNIWFANNSEIYEYITAYNSLIYSADGNMVYNPTVKEIWFGVDGNIMSIKPGETLEI